MEYYGYAGRVLYVDLTTGRSRSEPLNMDLARQFVGGCGIGAKLLWDALKPGTEPASPDNPIVISAGPLVGTVAPSASKIQMLTKSLTPASQGPAKYYVAISSAGTHRFGAMMKMAGYDQIVITGRAASPSYLKIVDDDVTVCDASDLWGRLDVYQTSDELTRLHPGSGVIAIGQAGERQTVFALGFVDKRNTVGRDGGATVMGAKNLKAIVVHGSSRIRIKDPQRLKVLADGIKAEAAKHTPFLNAVLPAMSLPSGVLPPNIDLVETEACVSCPTPCRTLYRVNQGEFAGTELRSGYWIVVPRYCQYMEMTDYTQMIKLIELFNNTGTCFITALAMIKFVVAMYQNGAIGKAETGGLDLKMGDFRSYMGLAEKLVRREDIGDVMARGWLALSEAVGVSEDGYINTRGVIKGTSVILGAEGRRLGLLFETLVDPRGGMHLHPLAYYLNKPMAEFRDWGRDLAMSEADIARIFSENDFDTGRFTKHYEEGEAIYWSLGTCVFGVMLRYQSLRRLAELYSAATGIETAPEELKLAGERIWNLYRLLNVREGFTRADDRCPGLWARSLEQPVEDFVFGTLQVTDYFGRPVTRAGLEAMLDHYYDEHVWDPRTGIPTPAKLAQLGLGGLCSTRT